MSKAPINDRSVWRADDFATPRAWSYDLDDAMRDDIDSALRDVETRAVPWHAITRDDFALPRMADLLSAMATDLESGAGFAVLGGFDANRYSRDQNRTAFCGISAHLGQVVSQTSRGDRIIDVVDIGKPYDHTSRGYSSNRMLPFHTDGADLAGLHCLGEAEHGGQSIIISASTAYNILLEENPAALAILERGFFHHRRGEQGPGEGEVSDERIPVFSFHNDLLHCMYNRNPIEWVEHAGLSLTDEEVNALDALDEVLGRREIQLHMDMRTGDLQFINNFITFHSRTEYSDGENSRRHLLRIWLENTASRRTGPTLLDLYAPADSRATRT